MRNFLRLATFSTFFATALQVTGQTDNFTYAITDFTKEGMNWNVLRKLDLKTGTYSDVLLNGTNGKIMAFDATTKKQILPQNDSKTPASFSTPFSTGVAAMAYDKKHNRIYFTPMFVDQLRYIDLSSMKLYYVTDQPFTGFGRHHDQGKIVTRMVIAPDGKGYAVTSDGHALIQFTTGKKPTITSLGALTDDPANKDISIHQRMGSYGGDMIADDEGNLIIITARNLVFKVSVATKIATYLGTIQGLPADFTTNGAVVDAAGNLMVSSALSPSAPYVVDLSNLQAKPSAITEVFRTSDLANSNYLSHNKNQTETNIIPVQQPTFNSFIRVYPNPVVNNYFKIQFNNVDKGDYTLEVTNLMGQRVLQRKLNISNEVQMQEISLPASNAKGIYLVKIFDFHNKSVQEQKIMVQ